MRTHLRLSVVSLGVLSLAFSGYSRAAEPEVLESLARSKAKYDTPEAWAARRTEIREGFLKAAGLSPLPKLGPLSVIRHGARKRSGYTVENVAIETLPGFYCTGNLYRPTDATAPQPLVLCPHGHFFPLGRQREEQQIRCAHLAKMGATVFSYSMVGWQDSRQTTHDDPLVLALQTWNSVKVVDFLTSLAGVDPERIAITGASGGGSQSIYAALVDERIDVIVPAVILYAWTEKSGCRCEGGLPIMRTSGTNVIELASALAPRPQLVLSVGGGDPGRHFPTDCYPYMLHFYDLAGAAGAVRSEFYEHEEHDYGPSKRNAMYAFLCQHLGLAAVAEDRNTIEIETPESLTVFDADHPLPASAVLGEKAVARAFASLHAPEKTSAPAAAEPLKISGDKPIAEYSFPPSTAADEALIFTPDGFDRAGQPAAPPKENSAKLKILTRVGRKGPLTPCRINVVGSDGAYYEPVAGELRRFSLTGVWPQAGAWGNRQEKAPIRYFGHFFYSTGDCEVEVPAGATRVEVWKGLEFRPVVFQGQLAPGESKQVDLILEHVVPMPTLGYHSGDPHIHIPRRGDDDDRAIFDLLAAEDVHVGGILAYNEPAGPYAGFMEKLDSPQFRGLGKRSEVARGAYRLISGQEYRTVVFGHLNLFLLDELVRPGEAFNADDGPIYGDVLRAAHEAGGIAWYAHGGYAQEIYADIVQGTVDAVELLQFGVYRGMGLIDWYHVMNAGFRLPTVAACDFPACRKLADCVTYVHTDTSPDAESWIRGAAQGRSFVTTGPLLLLDVDGQRPGGQIDKSGKGPHQVNVRIRARSEVAPITQVQLIVNGRVAQSWTPDEKDRQGTWLEFERAVELDRSSWIATRAFSLSRLNTPDAEAHSNPVFVTVDGRAPYEQASLDVLVERINQQIEVHSKRVFPQQAQVLAYFERSRDILMKIRAAGGAPASGHPSDLALESDTLEDLGSRLHDEASLKAYLRPVPPKPIQETLDGFETVGGFRMELVAREPLVYDPVAASFDADGNLYVAEMRDYPYKPRDGQPPLGTIRELIDDDGDGVFDRGEVFADELLWPAGVAPWGAGIYVAASPDIWYLEDTDGDHRADVRRKVFSGFGVQNQQGMVNNLVWGPDHKIYGSTAVNGGEIVSWRRPNEPPIRIDGRDFRFDPRDEILETVTGTVQFGATFDDWGHRFLCSESQPLLQAVLPQSYLERNPYLPVPSAVHPLAEYPVPIFRVSPIERWRKIRSSRRIAHGNRPATSAGASHHVVDAAAGVTVYRGGAYPPEYYGSVFVGDAQNNLIHRRVLTPQGGVFASHRGDPNTEFVRSPDNWFRPVNFVNAPDGTLYVLDMSREILEAIHIPSDVVKFLDLTSGRETGRVYRLAPPGFRYPGPIRLQSAPSTRLVAELASPDGWRRDTAQRLLFERQDTSVVPELSAMVRSGATPQARIGALWALEGLASLGDEDLLAAIADVDEHVRELGMKLAESRLDRSSDLLQAVLGRLTTDDASERFQLAFTLGASSDPAAATALAQLARADSNDVWTRTAILSSVAPHAAGMFATLVADSSFLANPQGPAFLGQLLGVVGARLDSSELARVLDALEQAPSPAQDGAWRRYYAQSLGDGARRGGGRLDTLAIDSERSAFLARLADHALIEVAELSSEPAARVAAVRLLACYSFARVGEGLISLLEPKNPDEVQIAALEALAGFPEESITQAVLARWSAFLPTVRGAAIEFLASRPERTIAWLETMVDEPERATSLDASRETWLENHPNDRVRELTRKLLAGAGASSATELIERYKPALRLARDATRGEAIFRRECAVCHKLGAVGVTVGPDLTSSSSRDAEALLSHILDPNKTVLPNYLQYTIVDEAGRVYSGIVIARAATSVTLARAENKTDTILRSEIAEFECSKKSLMPEGLDRKISPQEMADLIEFLQASQRGSPTAPAPLEIGTEPGLIEPE